MSCVMSVRIWSARQRPNVPSHRLIQCCWYQNHQGPIYVVNWHFLTHVDVKSAAILFFKYSVNSYGLGLSDELLFIIIAQGASKL